jgi:hypothetical protein
MALKGKERPAAEALVKLLTELGREADWEEGEDPPDVIVRLKDKERWGLEVTALHQYFETDTGERSRKAVENPLVQMCEEIKAHVADIENAQYLLTGTGPIEKADREKIVREAEAHIRSGSTDPTDLGSHGRIQIRTVKSPVPVSYMIGLDPVARTPGGGRLVADIAANLNYALDRILADKLPVLRQLTAYDRRVLFIWAEHFFAEPDTVRGILDSKRITSEDVDVILLQHERQLHWVADPSHVFV